MTSSRGTDTAPGRKWSSFRWRKRFAGRETAEGSRPTGSVSASRPALFELVKDVPDVIGDHQDGRRAGQPERGFHQRLDLLHFLSDSRLGGSLMAERIIKEDLIFLITGQPGPVQIHHGDKEHAQSPDRPNHRNHSYTS